MSIELVLLTPVLVAAIFAIAGGARYVEARGQTSAAAYAAGRAASLTSTQPAAIAAGRRAATQAFAEHGMACAQLSVRIDTSGLRPGGQLRATVVCTANLSDLSGFGLLPGHKTFTSTAVVPIEEHRVL